VNVLFNVLAPSGACLQTGARRATAVDLGLSPRVGLVGQRRSCSSSRPSGLRSSQALGVSGEATLREWMDSAAVLLVGLLAWAEAHAARRIDLAAWVVVGADQTVEEVSLRGVGVCRGYGTDTVIVIGGDCGWRRRAFRDDIFVLGGNPRAGSRRQVAGPS